MDSRSLGTRLVDALASLRLAVVVIVALGAACAAATFYEARQGTAAAQRVFYQTGWFTALLVLLGLNILFSVLKRYPWTRDQAGFLMAHVGILVLLAGSLITLRFGLDGRLALYEGEEGDRVSLPAQALHVGLPGHQVHADFGLDLQRHPPRPGDEQRLAIADSGETLVLEDAAAHVEVDDGLEEGEGGVPALHFALQGSFAGHDGWLMASDPERSRFDFGPVVFELSASGTTGGGVSPATDGVNRLAFVASDGRLAYTLTSRKGGGSRGPVVVGQPIQTPWMGMLVVVDRFLPSAVAVRRVVASDPPASEERRVPAVRIRLEGRSGRTDSEWVAWNEVREIPFAGGQATVAFRASEAPLPFRVQLVSFQSQKYPGSDRAATYESRVRVDDPEGGTAEHIISMNRPLRHRGYVLFQSSFVDGEPAVSIFSVSRAPGLPLVYLGTALISLGVGWMFYLKPWLLKRQAARARARYGAAAPELARAAAASAGTGG
jgi:ResB-like family